MSTPHTSTTTHRAPTTVRLRRLAVFVTTSIALVGLMALPAAADAPTTYSETETVLALNPCTDQVHRMTVTFESRLHQHGDREVEHFVRSGSTDDGYVLFNGVETYVSNGNAERATFVDMWRSDDGSAFQIRGRFVETDDGVVVEDIVGWCITD